MKVKCNHFTMFNLYILGLLGLFGPIALGLCLLRRVWSLDPVFLDSRLLTHCSFWSNDDIRDELNKYKGDYLQMGLNILDSHNSTLRCTSGRWRPPSTSNSR